jgi:hypothetical protein
MPTKKKLDKILAELDKKISEKIDSQEALGKRLYEKIDVTYNLGTQSKLVNSPYVLTIKHGGWVVRILMEPEKITNNIDIDSILYQISPFSLSTEEKFCALYPTSEEELQKILSKEALSYILAWISNNPKLFKTDTKLQIADLKSPHYVEILNKGPLKAQHCRILGCIQIKNDTKSSVEYFFKNNTTESFAQLFYSIYAKDIMNRPLVKHGEPLEFTLKLKQDKTKWNYSEKTRENEHIPTAVHKSGNTKYHTDIYFQKYLLYKQKYLELKKQLHII